MAAGRIRGRRRGGVWSYSGVPYARSPEGPLRWRSPLPPEPWAGIRDATAFGPMAPQPPPIPGVSVPGDPVEQSEDCLTLNVWTPAPDGGRRPVMVWIHGGGFTSGTGAGLLYRGADLAFHGDVVVVTINYRLGALGFLGPSGVGRRRFDTGHVRQLGPARSGGRPSVGARARVGLRWRPREGDRLRRIGRRHERVGDPGDASGRRTVSAGDHRERAALHPHPERAERATERPGGGARDRTGSTGRPWKR